MKNRIIKNFIVLTSTFLVISACNLFSKDYKPTANEELSCPALPTNFSKSDLVGTWVAEYFGGLATDKLIIRDDGYYKQIYSSKPRNFESDWKKWQLENNANGFALLHLEGMRRCDDIESICNNPGGGLPDGEVAINQCNEGNIHYSNEVILLVTGYSKEVPQRIVLRQARLAGSDWTYSFRLEK